MTADDWIKSNYSLMGSDYEVLFAKTVLTLVDGLKWDTLRAQHPFFDNDGRQRYTDFAIIESDAVRIAIEIDGYDKRGSGTGMSHGDFIDWQRRQASLAAQGWHVLRFANRDVRDHPQTCAEYVAKLLAKLRMHEGGRVEIVTIQAPPPVATPPTLTPPERVSPESQPTKTRNKGRSYFETITLATLIFVGIGTFVWTNHKNQNRSTDGQPLLEDSKPEGVQNGGPAGDRPPGASYGELDCSNPVDWTEAEFSVGKRVIVSGTLAEAKGLQGLPGNPFFFNIGNKFPDRNRLSVVIWGQNSMNFDMGKLAAAAETAKEVCVEGEVSLYKGTPQIEISDPKRIRITGGH